MVGEGLFVLGTPNYSKVDPADFNEWDLPLDEAMAKIEKAYIQDYPEEPTSRDWKPRFK